MNARVPVSSVPSAHSVSSVSPIPEPVNPFRRLMAIDVSKHIERKGQFDYLSWPFAVAQLRLADPTATWEVKRFDGLPYLKTQTGFYVEVEVKVQDVRLSQVHPVLDGRNRPIASPTSFDINTSIQRCLVKAIALHGLGLSIYAGEDLVEVSDAGDALTQRTESRPALAAPIEDDPLPPAADYLSTAQLRYVERLIDDTGTDVEHLLQHFGFESLDAIPRSEASRVIRALQSKRRAA